MRLIKAKVVLLEEQKAVTKNFFIDTETFGGAEQIIAEAFGTNEYKAMEYVNFSDFVDMDGEFFFKVVSDIVTANEVTAKESRSRIVTLVKGSDVETVTEKFKEKKDFSEELVSVTKINVEDIIK